LAQLIENSASGPCNLTKNQPKLLLSWLLEGKIASPCSGLNQQNQQLDLVGGTGPHWASERRGQVYIYTPE
jgi:hypothetical protein